MNTQKATVLNASETGVNNSQQSAYFIVSGSERAIQPPQKSTHALKQLLAY